MKTWRWSLLAALAAMAVMVTLLAEPLQTHAAAWQQTGPWVLAGGLCGLVASHLLRAGRLRQEWHPRIGADWRDCLCISLVGSAAVNLLPMRAGEAGHLWLLRQRWGVGWADAAASLLWMRLQDACVVGWLAVLAACVFVGPAAGLPAWLGVSVVAASTALFIGLATHGSAVVRSRALRSVAARLSDRPRMVAVGRTIGEALDRMSPATWCWSLTNWVVKVGTLGAVYAAMSDVSLRAGVLGALAGELAAALPVQPPAGFGAVEAAMAVAAASLDTVPAGRLLAAALVVHLGVIGVSLIGGAVSLAALTHRRAPRTTAEG